MNVNRGGAFQDESFGSARASALRTYREVYGPESPEFAEFGEQLRFDCGEIDMSNEALHAEFLKRANAAIRPQDRAAWL